MDKIYNEIHVIDDEDFYLNEAKMSLEDIGYKGRVYYHNTVESFLKAQKNINQPCVVVVDYDLNLHTVKQINFRASITNQNVKKVVLISIISLKNKGIEGYDMVASKFGLDWRKIIRF